MLGNTYHLYLRPGDDLIARRGGLHRFIGWNRPILTDSGGYQVFSLARGGRSTRRAREFRSHLDGSAHLLTPERAVDIQAQLGSDIAMVLDECLALPRRRTEDAARDVDGADGALGAARARRGCSQLRDEPRRADVVVTNPGQAQFGIVQGGIVSGPARRERAAHGRDRLRGATRSAD